MTNVTTYLLNSTVSSDNSTVFSYPGQEEPVDTSDEFSVQTVVGIFLTLALCLLTQPYGSLFYNPPPAGKSEAQHALFFPWRLNPLACIAETVVILLSLFHAMRLAFQDSETLLPSISRKFPYYHAKTERSRNWRRHWHLHAAALLIIRANPEGDKGDGVLERLMADSLLENVEPGPGEELLPHLPRGGIREGGPSGGTGGPDVEQDVEAGLLPHSGQDRLADLRKILGHSVLAHKEKWVDLVTSFSALVVTIKLAATTLPWTVRVPVAFFLASWSSVQLLLYLFHLGELDETSAPQIVKTIRLQRHNMANPATRHWTTGLVFLAVAGPVSWLSFWAGFPDGEISPCILFTAPDDYIDESLKSRCATSLDGATLYRSITMIPWYGVFVMTALFFSILTLIIYFVIYISLDISFVSLLQWAMGSPGTGSGAVASLHPGIMTIQYFQRVATDVNTERISSGSTFRRIFAWFMLCLSVTLLLCSAFGYIFGGIFVVQEAFKSTTTVRVYNGLIGAISSAYVFYVLVFSLVSPARLYSRVDKPDRKRGVFVFITAVILPLYLFGLLLFGYDSRGTYQPAWLDILG